MLARRAVVGVRNAVVPCRRLVDVRVDERSGVATVAMRSPPVNALDRRLLRALADALDRLSSDRCRGVILTSALPDNFSAGLDLRELIEPKRDDFRDLFYALQDCWIKLYGASFPTAAAVNGYCFAAGCLLALSCAYRVMVDDDFTIGFNEVDVSITAPQFFQNVLRSTIPSREAELALITGKLYTPKQALQVGLVDGISEDADDSVSRCRRFISRYDRIDPLVRRIAMHGCRRRLIHELEETKEETFRNFRFQLYEPDTQRDLKRFLRSLKNKS